MAMSPTDETSTDPATGDDDFRCSAWTAAQGFDPIGSAPEFDRLVTVEVPQPWPPAVEDMEWVAALDRPKGTRIQAIVADVGREDGSVLLTRWERHRALLAGIDWLVPAPDAPAALAALVAGDDPSELGGVVTEAPDEVLICGHGSRDRCCGGAGTRLMIKARAALGEVRVRRTSHLGGHRFAPTALTLPDGRMWAFLDIDAIIGIVRRTMPAPDAREFYRGNVGLDAWSQVVEGAVLADSGWDAVNFTDVTGTSVVDGDRAMVRLRWSTSTSTDERSTDVEVVGRYPVLQCGLAPSEAKKDAPEYRLA